jgi:hypothetical protein
MPARSAPELIALPAGALPRAAAARQLMAPFRLVCTQHAAWELELAASPSGIEQPWLLWLSLTVLVCVRLAPCDPPCGRCLAPTVQCTQLYACTCKSYSQ